MYIQAMSHDSSHSVHILFDPPLSKDGEAKPRMIAMKQEAEKALDLVNASLLIFSCHADHPPYSGSTNPHQSAVHLLFVTRTSDSCHGPHYLRQHRSIIYQLIPMESGNMASKLDRPYRHQILVDLDGVCSHLAERIHGSNHVQALH
jgi:hypothetical protein